MGTKPTLILFARQPHFGVGKTRLAKRLGKRAAWQFQRRQLLVLSKLAQDTRWHFQISWAHRQGKGDLGKRLERALAGSVGLKRLIIGSDILDLKAAHVAEAFRALDGAPHVLGPSPDGGFWCIGSRGPVRLKGIRWSSEFTLGDTAKALKNIRFISELSDLD